MAGVFTQYLTNDIFVGHLRSTQGLLGVQSEYGRHFRAKNVTILLENILLQDFYAVNPSNMLQMSHAKTSTPFSDNAKPTIIFLKNC